MKKILLASAAIAFMATTAFADGMRSPTLTATSGFQIDGVGTVTTLNPHDTSTTLMGGGGVQFTSTNLNTNGPSGASAFAGEGSGVLMAGQSNGPNSGVLISTQMVGTSMSGITATGFGNHNHH